MKQIGTLVGATVRVNDDQDLYPVAIDNEIKGGLHSVTATTDRDAIPASRRSAGMQCYCAADGNTYELGNDLVTWTLLKGTSGGSTDPGTGGDSPTVALISGNFGAWTDPDNKSNQFVNESFPLQYKGDLLAFGTRAIVYLQGNFGLNAAFVGTTLVLGNLPLNYRPAAQLKKWLVTNNIEMFLVIDITGDISLQSKDGFNLPVSAGSPEAEPYYIECFFKPVVVTAEPTVWTSVRTADFTRNNCGSQDVASTVSYSQSYTSTIDQDTADALAAADTTFDASGQAYANANGTCTLDPTRNAFVTNNRNAGSQQVIYTDAHGAQVTLGGVNPGTTAYQTLGGTNPYSVEVINTSGPTLYASVNGGGKIAITPFGNHTFAGLNPTITLVVTDS